MSSPQEKAIRGTIWTIFGYGSSQALRLVANLVLTRLLLPEMFGLMALVNTFIIGLNLFSDLGINVSVIRSKRLDDPQFLNTAWTIQVLRGFIIWIFSLLIARYVANFYGNTNLEWMIPVAGLGAIISGFTSNAIPVLNRKLEIGKLTRLDLNIQIISLIVMIIWAYIRQTIWALLGGNIISTLLRTIWSHQLDPKIKHGFAWDKDALREIISFGRWIFISTMMTFLASQSDRLLLGKLLSLTTLGVYTVAFYFADIPKQIISKINSNVLFPLICQENEVFSSSVRANLLRRRWLILVGSAILVTFLFSTGDIIIQVLYDSRYKQAGWMLSIMSIGIWPVILNMTINQVLMAIGKPQYVAIGNFLKVVYMLVLVPLGYNLMGLFGVIIVITLNDIPGYLVVNYGLWKEKFSGIAQDFYATLLFLIFLWLSLLIRSSLGLGFPWEQGLDHANILIFPFLKGV